MNKPKSLFKIILLTPITIIIVSLLLVMSSFHFVMKTYTRSLTNKTIKEEFSIMDSIYKYPERNGKTNYDDRDTEGLVVTAQHLFFDKNRNLVVPTDFWYGKEDKKYGEKIGEYVHQLLDLEIGDSFKAKVGGKTYIMEVREYDLSFDDGIMNPPEEGKHRDKYYILIYTDVTSMQGILDTMDVILALVIVLTGLISILVMLHILKGVAKSFKSLDLFLHKIGKKEYVGERPTILYEEFENIIDTTYDMKAEIKKSEDVQKQFFQNASHELRTPLMSIQGYAEGLKYGVIKETGSAYDIILDESKKMKDLVDEILFLSKFEAGNMDKDEVDIGELLYSTAGELYGLIETNKLKVEWSMDKSMYIEGNEKFLQRSFSNIISNAIRYAETRIEISARKVYPNEQLSVRSKDKKMNIEIHIIDDGSGINDEDRPHIFERFYKGKGGSFGIGLSMAKDIIDQHGGVIDVESKKGRTDFKIVL